MNVRVSPHRKVVVEEVEHTRELREENDTVSPGLELGEETVEELHFTRRLHDALIRGEPGRGAFCAWEEERVVRGFSQLHHE